LFGPEKNENLSNNLVMPHTRMKNSLVILSLSALVFLTGCTSTEHLTRNYEYSKVFLSEKEYRGYRVKEGNKTVLQKSLYKTSRPMVPDGISGYTLLIELERPTIEAKRNIKLPSEYGRAFLYTLNAPSYKNAEDLKGEIKIVGVEKIGIRVWIRLFSAKADWSFEGENLYKFAPINCFGMKDDCIATHK
jgi:hypothetical protein